MAVGGRNRGLRRCPGEEGAFVARCFLGVGYTGYIRHLTLLTPSWSAYALTAFHEAERFYCSTVLVEQSTDSITSNMCDYMMPCNVYVHIRTGVSF